MNLVADLAGKIVLITGASRGIGRACALMFSELGCKVAIHFHKNHKAATEVSKELATEHSLIQADLAQEIGCKKLIAETVEIYRKIDVLVLNHGIWERGEIDKISAEEINRTFQINMTSLFFLIRDALPFFPKKEGGAIVLISSTAGQRGEANYSHYAASKGGVISLTKSLAAELAQRKIRINSVAPGWVDTDLSKDVLQGAYRHEVIATIPLGKIAQPEDIAPAVVFLASGYARHITGEILNVNGGSVLCG